MSLEAEFIVYYLILIVINTFMFIIGSVISFKMFGGIKDVLDKKFTFSKLITALITVSILTFSLGEIILNNQSLSFLFFFFAGIFYNLYLYASFGNLREKELKEKIEQAEKKVEENPDKSHPLWDLSRKKLEVYIERNLSQVRSIYWITLIIMTVGFILISYGVVKSFQETNFNGAVLTTAAGILTEFIAATFLFIFKATMKQASEYVTTLERINSIGMAIQIVDSLPDDQSEKKIETKALIAAKLAG